MNPRLQQLFHDDDGLRQVLLTGVSARDHVFVDLATGALAMEEALEHEARKRDFKMVLRLGGLGDIHFASTEMQTRFNRETELNSTDPTATNTAARALPPRGGSAGSASTATQTTPTATADPAGADAMRAAIGRIERALAKINEPFFIHFTALGQLISANTVSSDRARHVYGEVGRLLAAGKGHAGSRIVVTVSADVQVDALGLLSAHDLGATPWHIASIPLPKKEEIADFLARAKDIHRLQGHVDATAGALSQRCYTLTRITEALRRRIADGDTDVTSIIGGEFNATEVAAVQQRLAKLVGLTEIKHEFNKLVEETRTIETALRAGQYSEPPSTHTLLLGRPGTGKTEVAGLIAQLLSAAGVRRNSVFVRADVSNIVGQYNSGEALQNMRKLAASAAGGVLFIDEAYALAESEWGRQAINVLIAEMENRRGDLTVILAGYEDRMRRLLRANEGLQSRIAHEFHLPDFKPDELCEILDRRLSAASVKASSDARLAAHSIIRREAKRPHANARDVRTRFEAWNRNRLVDKSSTLESRHVIDTRVRSPEEARRLIAEYETRFQGLVEPASWMRKVLVSSADEIGRGDLARAPRLVFTGPPGTGKTETARLIGSFLKACGVLREGRVREISCQDLTSRWVGGAQENTEREFRDSAECVLFIDEIYRLADDRSQGGEILNQLVQHMTDPEFDNVCVIVAGYEARMEDVYRCNHGLRDRLDATIRFAVPDATTLADIALRNLNETHSLAPMEVDRPAVLAALTRAMSSRRDGADFAGARSAIKLASEVRDTAITRSNSQRTLIPSDVPAPPPPRKVSIVVEEFLREFPGRDELGTALQSLLATAALRSRAATPPTQALGIRILGDVGTGKTTFARWIASKLTQREGKAPAPFEEKSVLSLQGAHLGEAQTNVRRLFERNLGGFIFLDEFHNLYSAAGQSNLYSHEIAQEITASMTAPANARTTVFIAGYPGRLERALAIDPGLASRFNVIIEVTSPSDALLAALTCNFLRESVGELPVSSETLSGTLAGYFARRRALDGAEFANCRAAKQLAESIAAQAFLRVDGEMDEMSIDIEDILKAVQV